MKQRTLAREVSLTGTALHTEIAAGHFQPLTEHEAVAELRAVLAGQSGAYRDIVVLNAAAALVVAGKAPDLKSGVARAGQAIDTGGAKAVLERLVAITNGRA